jgi:hypothetical protein
MSGLFGRLFGGKPAEPAKPKESATNTFEKKLCPTCQRALLPGTPCPFCHPQQFGEELSEGTISREYRPQAGVHAMGGVIVATQLAQQHGAKGFLHVFQGANKGLSLLLANKAITIGRKAEENMLALNDGGVSSKHCEVRPVQGGYELVDTGSKNGTFVNDQRVKEKVLVNGDLIAFGNTRIYVGLF